MYKKSVRIYDIGHMHQIPQTKNGITEENSAYLRSSKGEANIEKYKNYKEYKNGRKRGRTCVKWSVTNTQQAPQLDMSPGYIKRN